MAQTEFDRQAEVTRLLLEGISSTHVSPAFVSCWVLAASRGHRANPQTGHPILTQWCLEYGLAGDGMGMAYAEARG